MNILFLTIGRFSDIEAHAIYPDLLRQFIKHGHKVFSVSANEKRLNKPTEFIDGERYAALHVKTGNMVGCGMIEKGISTLRISGQYKRAFRKYLSREKFDLILYSTPPITLTGVVSYIKKKTNAVTCLLLKDIFPQNAIDIGVLRKSGIKGLIYRYFLRKEKNLYRQSDYIGCMSPANRDYLLQKQPWLSPDKVGISPNCIEVRELPRSEENRRAFREKYGLPQDQKIFVYGGNLGKPQGVPFIIECLRAAREEDAFFLIVGSGTDYGKLERYIGEENAPHVRLLKQLPKDDYDTMLVACDVGLIFLDHRFTIPNFPSRLLPYMQARLPVIACTDPNTDVGQVICDGGFGWKCESDSAEDFVSCVRQALGADLSAKGNAAFDYLTEHFSAESQYENIMRSVVDLEH